MIGIGGSLRAESVAYQALEYALGRVRSRGCATEVFDLRTNALPFCNGDKRDPRLDYPAVARLRARVQGAHAVVLATPEYHGGVSGVLKNAIDLLDFDHLEGKVVGAISVLGGRSTSNALNELRTIVRWCRALMIPQQVAIPQARTAFSGACPRDPDLVERFDAFAADLVRTVALLNPEVVHPWNGDRCAAPELEREGVVW